MKWYCRSKRGSFNKRDSISVTADVRPMRGIIEYSRNSYRFLFRGLQESLWYLGSLQRLLLRCPQPGGLWRFRTARKNSVLQRVGRYIKVATISLNVYVILLILIVWYLSKCLKYLRSVDEMMRRVDNFNDHQPLN